MTPDAIPQGTDTDSTAASLLQSIRERTVVTGVIGLGYVGLPTCLALVERGVSVLGFDVDTKKVDLLEKGVTYIEHLDGDRVRAMTESGRFSATNDFSRLAEPDALIICVPTPLTWQREPEMRFVRTTCEQIAVTLRRGQLVLLESTTYPGTTDELVKPILESSGLRCGEDFFLAFSPEREDPGNKHYSTSTIPKVVGGVDERSGELATALYSEIVSTVVQVSSARSAEATKLTENIFRAVNIALVNELKVIYDAMGIDVWEVLDAASSKPFGFMKFNPGPGWGGHCIPIDPFYLTWKAREHGISTRFIELAGEVNVEMPRYVIAKLQQALNERGRAVKDSKVLVLGVAYKKNVDDSRESPAFVIIDRLLEYGANVRYHDPHVPTLPRTRRWPHLPQLTSVSLDSETLEAQDAVLLITDHDSMDYDLILKHASLIVDTRGVFREGHPAVVKA